MGASHSPALLGIGRRGLIVQTAVRSVVIIVHPPAFHNIFQFGQIQKQFTIQQLISYTGVERFNIAIFPGTAWLNRQGLYTAIT